MKRIKVYNSLLTLLFSIFSLNFSFASFTDLEDLNIENHVKMYNQLPSVEYNDNIVTSHPRVDSLLKDVEQVISQYAMQDYLGLRLIHSHFQLNNNQIMVEEFIKLDNVPSLVTSDHQFEEAKIKKARPASWIFSKELKENPLVFETSTDEAVTAGTIMLQKNLDFVEAIRKIVTEYEMNDIFSLAVLKRESLKPQSSSMEEVYVENNYKGLSNVSVVQLDTKDVLKSDMLIPTSWSFGGDNKKYACQATKYCRRSGDHHFQERDHYSR
jgi:hypothetical protein